MEKKVKLKRGSEFQPKNGHPWVFSGAIAEVEGKILPGELVTVLDSRERFLAYGYYNDKSNIRIRLLEWDKSKKVNAEWWKEKIKEAVVHRSHFNIDDSYRLIFSEADFIPGLIVDKYLDFLIFQSLTAGIERVKDILINALISIINPTSIFERSEGESRQLEGLDPVREVVFGQEIPEKIIVTENRLRFYADIIHGQKTGFYLDQRENRELVCQFVKGKKVLDCFCFTGGFSLYALKNGAKKVISIDSSAPALNLADKNVKINDFSNKDITFIEGNVFEELRYLRDKNKTFDVIILDPPKLAPTVSHKSKAIRAYKDLNILGMKLLNKNGILATFSCSGGITRRDFRRILYNASNDTGKRIQILKSLSQPTDHPIRLSMPESEYLKGFICRVL